MILCPACFKDNPGEEKCCAHGCRDGIVCGGCKAVRACGDPYWTCLGAMTCRTCRKAWARWEYIPGDSIRWYCDDCVPRGCSCNMLEDGSEEMDEKGRRWPCVEFEYR